MTRKFKFVVGDDVDVKAEGFSGPECEAPLDSFLQSCGLTEEISSEHLPEYHQEVTATEEESH